MRCVMPGGARLTFAYLERDADAESYQGHSYTRVYVEEAGNFPSPAPILKLLLGDGAQVVLEGQRVLPERLLAQGFQFHYPELSAALAAATSRSPR